MNCIVQLERKKKERDPKERLFAIWFRGIIESDRSSKRCGYAEEQPMNRAIKCRIDPTREQRVLFEKTFGCCRFLYNRMLTDRLTGEYMGEAVRPSCIQKTSQRLKNRISQVQDKAPQQKELYDERREQ